MKSILDVIPEIGSILDNLISTPEEKRSAELKLREIDVREVEARLGVQRAWLSNDSFFVAGAIPAILWMVSLVVFFNCVVAPLLSPFVTLATLALPDWYASLATSVVLGLLGKKAYEQTEITWHGSTVKTSRKRIEAELANDQRAERSETSCVSRYAERSEASRRTTEPEPGPSAVWPQDDKRVPEGDGSRGGRYAEPEGVGVQTSSNARRSGPEGDGSRAHSASLRDSSEPPSGARRGSRYPGGGAEADSGCHDSGSCGTLRRESTSGRYAERSEASRRTTEPEPGPSAVWPQDDKRVPAGDGSRVHSAPEAPASEARPAGNGATIPSEGGAASEKRAYESPEEIDARIREIAREKGLAW